MFDPADSPNPELHWPEDICENCAAPSDDGLTTVCVEAAEPRDYGFPGCDAVTEDWCPVCVKSVQHLGIVSDDEPEPDPDVEWVL